MIKITLTKTEKETLEEGFKNHKSHVARKRFHCILLLNNGLTVLEISKFYNTRTRTIYSYISRYKTLGIAGMFYAKAKDKKSILNINSNKVVEEVKKKLWKPQEV